MTKQAKTGADAWSNYWRKGFLTTFVGEAQEDHSDVTREFWEAAFAKVPAGGTIVDLGAGNGAILDLACAYFKQHDRAVNLIAVDYADVTSASEFYSQHPEVAVLNNTGIEQTGIDSESVDLCVSRFGFEYAEPAAAAQEVSRILKPGGAFQALIHHAASVVALRSKSAIEQITLCQRSELTDTTAKLLKRLNKLKKSHRAPEDDPKAEELRDHFNRMATRVNDYADRLPDADHVTYFLNELGSLFSRKAANLTLDQKLEIIKQVDIDSDEYHVRMLSMLNASQDQAGIDKIKAAFESSGMTVPEPAELEQEGSRFAWQFSADKP